MIPIEEFQTRSLKGPVMKEMEFDMALATGVRKVVKKYGIKYDPQSTVVTDEVADLVYEAGADLLADVGIFNKDTFRVIQFSRDEIDEVARWRMAGPKFQKFGKGKDEVTIKFRTPDDPSPPATFFGASISPVSEEMFIPYAQSFAQEEHCHGFMGQPCSLFTHKGLEPKAATLSEYTVARAEIELTREALRRAGKPDLQIGPTFIAVSAGAVDALNYPGGLEPHNGMMTMHIMPEQKMEWSRLLLAEIARQRKIVPWTSSGTNLGLLCRGSEDCAVVQIANLLAQVAYGHGTVCLGGAVERNGSTSTRRAMWATGAKTLASLRNIGMLEGQHTAVDAGAGTEMACFERAAMVLNGVASGACWLFYPACRKGIGSGHTTGLEGRFMAETAIAVAGMKRDEANQLIQRILALYEPEHDQAPQGETFFELYDLDTLQPKPEYLAVHASAKEKLRAIGVPYK